MNLFKTVLGEYEDFEERCEYEDFEDKSQTLSGPTTQHDRHNEPQANHYLVMFRVGFVC